MYLAKEKSLCKANQAVVVSRDKKENRSHRAYNKNQKFELRHFRLDQDIFIQEKCCDFLLLNDTTKVAYFIELKGGKIDDAIEQLEHGVQLCKSELQEYVILYRIVCSKAKTHKIQSTKFRKFKERCGQRLILKENQLEESLY